jgi:competence protein ComEC
VLEFRRAPLLTAVCWFALGEIISRNQRPAVILLIATVLLSLLTLAALRLSLRIAIVPLAAVWMAIGCWCAEIQPVPPTQQALASYADGLSRQIRGRVVRVRELPPQQADSDHDKETGWWPEKEANEEAAATGALSVDIQVDSIEEVTPDISRMVPMTGGVRMNVIADKPANSGAANMTTAIGVLPTLKCGDVVESPMRIKLAERYRDPGAWQYADYLLAQGIGAHASVRASKV